MPELMLTEKHSMFDKVDIAEIIPGCSFPIFDSTSGQAHYVTSQHKPWNFSSSDRHACEHMLEDIVPVLRSLQSLHDSGIHFGRISDQTFCDRTPDAPTSKPIIWFDLERYHDQDAVQGGTAEAMYWTTERINSGDRPATAEDDLYALGVILSQFLIGEEVVKRIWNNSQSKFPEQLKANLKSKQFQPARSSLVKLTKWLLDAPKQTSRKPRTAAGAFRLIDRIANWRKSLLSAAGLAMIFSLAMLSLYLFQRSAKTNAALLSANTKNHAEISRNVLVENKIITQDDNEKLNAELKAETASGKSLTDLVVEKFKELNNSTNDQAKKIETLTEENQKLEARLYPVSDANLTAAQKEWKKYPKFNGKESDLDDSIKKVSQAIKVMDGDDSDTKQRARLLTEWRDKLLNFRNSDDYTTFWYMHDEKYMAILRVAINEPWDDGKLKDTEARLRALNDAFETWTKWFESQPSANELKTGKLNLVEAGSQKEILKSWLDQLDSIEKVTFVFSEGKTAIPKQGSHSISIKTNQVYRYRESWDWEYSDSSGSKNVTLDVSPYDLGEPIQIWLEYTYTELGHSNMIDEVFSGPMSLWELGDYRLLNGDTGYDIKVKTKKQYGPPKYKISASKLQLGKPIENKSDQAENRQPDTGKPRETYNPVEDLENR